MDKYPQERNAKALNQLVVATAPVVLAVLGPDVSGGGFGAASWVPGNFIGTNTVASTTGGTPDYVGGYVAQTDEVIEQITISSLTGPSADPNPAVYVPTNAPLIQFAEPKPHLLCRGLTGLAALAAERE